MNEENVELMSGGLINLYDWWYDWCHRLSNDDSLRKIFAPPFSISKISSPPVQAKERRMDI